jgi:hypothetical protein
MRSYSSDKYQNKKILGTADGRKTLKLDTCRKERKDVKWLTFTTSGFALQKEISLVC